MTSKTRSALGTEQTANFADNTTGAITPAIMRTTVQDMIDSTGTLLDSNVWSGSACNFTGGLLGNASTATAGYIGEYQSAAVGSAASISFTTGSTNTITSIALTAGDWDISGAVGFQSGGSTATIQILVAGVGSVAATLPGAGPGEVRYGAPSSTETTLASGPRELVVPPKQFVFSTSTTIYLVANASFAVSTLSAFGYMQARRRS